jgi:hypothetical protein
LLGGGLAVRGLRAEELPGEEPQTGTQSKVTTKRPASSVKAPPPITNSDKLHIYLTSTYGPTSLLRAAIGAGYGQARDSTPEWGQGMEGYGKRYASRFAQHAVKRTIQFSVGAMLHEDPRYYYSGKTGVVPRATYAAFHTLVTRKDDGSKAPAYGRFAGAFGAGLISRTWHPESSRNVRSGFGSGAVSLGIDAGFRVLHEFWPDIKRVFHR